MDLQHANFIPSQYTVKKNCKDSSKDPDLIAIDEVYHALKLSQIYPEGVYTDYRRFFADKKFSIAKARINAEGANAFKIPLFNWSMQELERIAKNIPIDIRYFQSDLASALAERKNFKSNWCLVSKEPGLTRKNKFSLAPTAAVVEATMIAYLCRGVNILKRLSFCLDSFAITQGTGTHTYVKAFEVKGPNGGDDKKLAIIISGITKSSPARLKDSLHIEYK